ncbi:uncharacterized protein [Panulirus ornatus]|uniref:uncharacterized protein n=1 Tax=Panulirus ornatus TaxID=150431 RepID=UPI003A88E0B2
MRTTRTAITFFVASCCLALLIQEATAAPTCKERDQPAPSDCTFGVATDWCRNEVCAKGPGERCGGVWWEEGKCGLGTSCSCGICTGCSSVKAGKCSPPIFNC